MPGTIIRSVCPAMILMRRNDDETVGDPESRSTEEGEEKNVSPHAEDGSATIDDAPLALPFLHFHHITMMEKDIDGDVGEGF